MAAYYEGEDLFDYTHQLEKDDVSNDPMGIHHGVSSNLESPESNKAVSPFSSQYNQESSLGTTFVQSATSQQVEFANADADIFSILEDMKKQDQISTQEIQMNYQHDFSSGHFTDKSCSVEEPISNLHEDEPYYEDLPGCSGIMHDMPRQTDDHIDQIINLTEEPIIDNRENVPTTSIQCPTTKQYFDIPNTELTKFLNEKGKKKQELPQMTEAEIKQLIRKFCIPREMSFVDKNDAKKLVESGYQIKRVEKKIMKKQGKKFVKRQSPLDCTSDHSGDMNFHCLLCPLTQGETRSFSRKEDLKRHYHQHLSFVRFECNVPGCTYKISRVDHMKTHMKNCHNESNNFIKHD